MRLPHEKYIIYLLTVPNISYDVITAFCEDHKLIVPTNTRLQEMQSNLTFPSNYSPLAPTFETRNWWKSLKVYDMWKGTAATKEALSILRDPKIREAVEYIILSPLDHSEFLPHVNFSFDKNAFFTYQHYFFNTSSFSQRERQDFLKLRGSFSKSIAACSDKALATGLFKFVIQDENTNISSGVLSRRLMDTLALRLVQMKHTPPSMEDAKALRSYASSLKIGQDIYNDSNAASEELLELFLNFEHGSDTEELLSYAELLEQKEM